MSSEALRVAVVGCGNISGPYGVTIGAYQNVTIAGATDIDPELSAAFVERFGGVAYPSLEALLADPTIDAVINLTSHGVHAEVTAAALEAGKHVHSEKPMAGSYPEARSLVELADANGVRLSCSPITFMGEAQEVAWRLLATGAIGTVRVVYAEVNWGRIETWHPRPEPFYAIGPLADVGVYPLTILTAIFGPVRRVAAHGKIVFPDRVSSVGEPFTVGAPDFGVAMVELEGGPLVRLTTSFYVGQHSKQRGIEFHGDTGSLFLSSWQDFDASVEVAPFGGVYESVPVPTTAFRGTDWGRALAELSSAISEGRPHRATGAQAAHVVEILDAIEASWVDGRAVDVVSTFDALSVPGSETESSRNANGHAVEVDDQHLALSAAAAGSAPETLPRLEGTESAT
jgi:predicted dehydrogenase